MNAEQLNLLKGLGCELGQGYHFARPLPGDEAAKFLATDPRQLPEGERLNQA